MINKILKYFNNGIIKTIFIKSSNDNILNKTTGFYNDCINEKIYRTASLLALYNKVYDIKNDFIFNTSYVDTNLIKIYLINQQIIFEGNLYFKSLNANQEYVIGTIKNNVPENESAFFLYSINKQSYAKITFKKDGNITIYCYDVGLDNSSPLSLNGINYIIRQSVKLL